MHFSLEASVFSLSLYYSWCSQEKLTGMEICMINSRLRKVFSLLMLILFCALSSCAYPEKLTQNNRVFSSSFEAESDFTGFYVVPQGEYDSSHELSSDNVYEGLLSHKSVDNKSPGYR